MKLLVIICVVVIFAVGLMMIFNTSSAEILDRALNKNIHQALLRQIIYGMIGLLAAIFIWKIGYIHLLHLSPYLLFLFLFLLTLVFVPEIGKMRNGAHRWIGIGNFTIQPSEFVKYLVPMVYIEWIVHHYKHQISFLRFCKIVSILAIPMSLIMIEPDNGTTAVIAISLLPLFFISGIRIKYWVLPVGILFITGTFIALQLPYVRSRVEVYLHPELDLKGKGHQPHQAKIAAGSGQLFGRGPGASLQKLTYLPEAQNDYIAAIYAEEFGFLGILLLIILYMLFSLGGFSIALKTPTVIGCYLATAITSLISLQAFLNLGVVSGLLPSKGVNLPFFSQGGTSLIANIIGLAILLNIGRDEEKENHSNHWRNRRACVSSASSRGGSI
ncbi:MAG: putative lipid II flippase FtsW [Chlamydiales bacterium]